MDRLVPKVEHYAMMHREVWARAMWMGDHLMGTVIYDRCESGPKTVLKF